MSTEFATFVLQVTITEDATGGSHIVSVTITPGAGSEFEVLYGRVTVGNTATSQSVNIYIDDGTNVLARFFEPLAVTTASVDFSFPTNEALSATLGSFLQSGQRYLVSGTMRLILSVTTAAVSVVQTFAVALRIRGPTLPTVTLGDTVGTPVIATNTSRVF